MLLSNPVELRPDYEKRRYTTREREKMQKRERHHLGIFPTALEETKNRIESGKVFPFGVFSSHRYCFPRCPKQWPAFSLVFSLIETPYMRENMVRGTSGLSVVAEQRIRSLITRCPASPPYLYAIRRSSVIQQLRTRLSLPSWRILRSPLGSQTHNRES